MFPNIIRVLAILAMLATAPTRETATIKPPIVIPGALSPMATATGSTNRDRT